MEDGPLSAAERDALKLAGKLNTHEAECAIQWKYANARLTRIELVLIAIVVLLLYGDGTVLEVVKRLIGN